MQKPTKYWLIAPLALLESFLLYISSTLSYCPLCSASPDEGMGGFLLALVGVVILLIPIAIGFFAERWQVAIVSATGAWFLVILSQPIASLVSHKISDGSVGLIFGGDITHLGVLVLSLFLLENLAIIGTLLRGFFRNRAIAHEDFENMN